MSKFGKYLDMALNYNKKGKSKKALKCWEKVLQVKPDYLTGWVMMGQDYEKLEDLDKARECYDKVLKINPSHQDAKWLKENLGEQILYDKGKELLKNKKFNKALGYFNRAIKKDQDNGLAWSYKGSTLIFLNRYEEANKVFDKAIELDPSRADNWIGKCDALVRFQRTAFLRVTANLVNTRTYEEALRCCHEALKLEPNKWWIHTAQLHEFYKHYREALECIEKALIYEPNNIIADKVKLAISNGLKYGKNFYIPISNSNLLTIIPFESDIIYSSRAVLKQVIGFNKRGYKKIRRLDTEMICTKKGFFSYSLGNVAGYIPWYKTRFSRSGKIIIDIKRVKRALIYRLKENPYLETRKEFEVRSKNFEDTIIGRFD